MVQCIRDAIWMSSKIRDEETTKVRLGILARISGFCNYSSLMFIRHTGSIECQRSGRLQVEGINAIFIHRPSTNHDTNQMQKGSWMRELVCTASSPQDIGKDHDLGNLQCLSLRKTEALIAELGS
ncbi:hypothetical protein AMTRI_Chr02g258020 [Amborella trichopoda]